MRLTSDTSAVEVVLGEAMTTTEPEWSFEAAEYYTTSTQSIPSPITMTDGAFNGTTTVSNAVVAPASGDQKQILKGAINNLDTVSHTFFVRINTGSTLIYADGGLNGVTVAAGASLAYDGYANTWTVQA